MVMPLPEHPPSPFQPASYPSYSKMTQPSETSQFQTTPLYKIYLYLSGYLYLIEHCLGEIMFFIVEDITFCSVDRDQCSLLGCAVMGPM